MRTGKFVNVRVCVLFGLLNLRYVNQMHTRWQQCNMRINLHSLHTHTHTHEDTLPIPVAS